MSASEHGAVRLLVVVPSPCRPGDGVFRSALSVAEDLHAEITFVAVVDRRGPGRTKHPRWPPEALGVTNPELDIHRVVLSGDPVEAIVSYARQIKADWIAVSARHRLGRWLFGRPAAMALAHATARPICVLPA